MKKRRFEQSGSEHRQKGGPTRGRSEERSQPKTGSSMLFGFLPVLERLRARPASVTKIYASENSTDHRLRAISSLAREAGVQLNRVSRETIDKLTGGEVNHQGLIAIVAPVDYRTPDNLFDAVGERPALFVILDGVEDPRNLGAILRSAECSGADGVFIPERRAVGLTDTVAKASAGAVEHIKVARVPNLNRLIEDVKDRKIWVVGTSGDAEMDYSEWDWTQPSALVLGSEGSGLHRLVAENCDVLVKIPMYGKIESLNVSVAAGVILFEARRQRSAISERG